MSFYTKIRAIFGGLIRCVYRIDIEGIEHIPEKGGLLLCANHTANADVVVLSAAVPRPINYMAKAELFKIPGLKQLITAFGAFPVKRGVTDTRSLKRAIELLESGEIVGMFPQGRRYKKVDPRGTRIKSGVGMIAYRAKSDILPVYIQTPKNQVKIFRRTKLIIGEVILYEALPFQSGTVKEYDAASAYIFDKICALDKAGER